MEAQLDTSRYEGQEIRECKHQRFSRQRRRFDQGDQGCRNPEIARVRAKVKMALAAAKSALSDSAAQVRGQARQVTKTTDNYVRDNPWQVVGIAAAVGIVLGMIMTRRSD